MDRQGYRGKHTAQVVVEYRPTRFGVTNGVVTLGGEQCPIEPQNGGSTFEVVPKFASLVKKLQKEYYSYEVSSR